MFQLLSPESEHLGQLDEEHHVQLPGFCFIKERSQPVSGGFYLYLGVRIFEFLVGIVNWNVLQRSNMDATGINVNTQFHYIFYYSSVLYYLLGQL